MQNTNKIMKVKLYTGKYIFSGDIEDTSASTSTSMSWSREATDHLIGLYEEHEEKLEDPRRKKKDVWKIITEGLNIAGFKFSQNQVEGKWRSLIASHKTLQDNKTKTGQKRKTLQYYERISAILSKRHDINPSFLSGNNVCTSQEPKPDTESSTSDTERKATETGKVNGRKKTSLHLHADDGKKNLDASESGTQLVELVLHLEKQSKTEREEREKRRDERAKEKPTSLDNFWKF